MLVINYINICVQTTKSDNCGAFNLENSQYTIS